MASQFDTEKVVLQPTQQEAPAQTNVFEQGAQVAAQQGAVAQQDASRQAGRMSQLYAGAIQTATAGFDRVLSAYNQYAEQKAVEEAPALIQRDGNGQLIAPSSFYPSGLHSMAYGQAYRRAAIQLYRESAANDFANYSAEMKARHPTDAVAYSAAMKEKQQAMLNGLADDQRPYMDLRFQGITGQAASQIAVSQQAAKNDVALTSYNQQMNGIANDGVRYSPLYGGPAATPAAAPGMIRSVTQGLPPSVQAGISYDRTPERNKEVGGAPDSQHLRPGSAADISTKGMPEAERQQLITSLMGNPHVRGLGFYDGHIHVDTDRTSRVTWGTPPAALKGQVDQWKAQPSPGGGMSSTDVAGDVARMRTWLLSNEPNAVMIRDRMVGANATAAQAGVPQVKHEQLLDDMALKMVIGAKAEQIKSLIFRPGADSIIDPAQIVEERNKIRAYAATEPRFKEQIEQSLMQALDYKIDQSNKMAQSSQLASQRVADGKIRDYNIRATQAELNPDPIAQAEAKRQLKQEQLDTLQDRNLSDSQAMRIAGAAAQASGVARAALQESNDKRLQGLDAIVRTSDPTVSVQQKADAAQQILAINSDPNIVSHLTVGQRNFAQNTLDTVWSQRAAADHTGVLIEADAGRVTPQSYQTMINSKVAAGTYGSHPGAVPGTSPPQLAALVAKQAANYNKNMTNEVNARDGMRAVAAGGFPSPTQIEAGKAKHPFVLPGEEVAADVSGWYNPQSPLPTQQFDPSNPLHRGKLVDHVRVHGYLPDRVKEDAENMKRVPNDEAMAGWVGLYRDLHTVAAERHARATGQRASDDEITTEVASQLGVKTTKFLHDASLYNAEVAFKNEIAAGSANSVTGQLGQSKDESLKAMESAPGNFAKLMVEKGESSTWLNKLFGGRIKDTEDERIVKGIIGVSPDIAPGVLRQTLAIAPSIAAVDFRGDTRSFLTGAANAELAVNGRAIAAMVKDGQTPQDYAFLLVMEKNKHLLEAVPTADGSKTMIGFKSFAKSSSEAMGRPDGKLNDTQVKAQLDAFVQIDAMVKGNLDGLPRYNQDTITAVPYLDSDNSAYWFIAARDANTGAPVKLMDLSQKDPRLEAQNMAQLEVGADILKKHFHGPGSKPVSDDRVDRYAHAFTQFVIAPMQGWMLRHYAAGSTDSQAFIQQFDKSLRDLNTRAGIQNAPNWQEVMDRIANDPTPADGRYGSVRDLARTYRDMKAREDAASRRPAPPKNPPPAP